MRRGKGLRPFPRAPFLASTTHLRFAPDNALDQSGHFADNQKTGVASLRQLSGFIPEQRPVSLRNRCSVSSESPDYFDEKLLVYEDLRMAMEKAIVAGQLPDQQIRLLNLNHLLDFHVFSFVKCFDPSLAEDEMANYYMEREWRLYGNLNFRLSDVRGVIVPRSFRDRLKSDLPQYMGSVRVAEDYQADTIATRTLHERREFPSSDPVQPPVSAPTRRFAGTGAESDCTDQYRIVTDAILGSSSGDAVRSIREVPGAPPKLDSRRLTIPHRTQIRVYLRDRFNCAYCGRRVVFSPVLRLFSEYFHRIDPGLFPYHLHWKITETHLAFWRDSASCDHLLPVARGGGSEEANLVCTCYMCNSMKQNWTLEELGWKRIEEHRAPWDGLTGAYPSLVDAVWREGPPPQYFRTWLKALESHGGI